VHRIKKMEKTKMQRKDFKDYYRQIAEVGSGTYGKVYKVACLKNENKKEDKYWAFKKITYSKDSEGFPQTALREIRILKSLNHPNVVKLHDIITSKPSENNKYKGSTFLIFDYLEHDLWGLIKNGAQLSTAQIKCIMKQLLEGMHYIHSENIIHRDIKSANILLNNKGELMIADFGLARNLNSLSGHYTSCVVTLWYRSPELLLGTKKYTTQVDIWSIGCIMAELILGTPLFPGDKEPRQCELIFQTCGTPNEKNWPGCTNLPYYSTYVPSNIMEHHERTLKNYFLKQKPFLDSVTLDFLDKLLTMNPEKRMTAKEALEHEYFTMVPLPCSLPELGLSKYQECHITLMNTERKKRENQRKQDDSNLRKRRYSEVNDKRGRPGNPHNEKAYSFKSPEINLSEMQTTVSRTTSYFHGASEQRMDNIPPPPQVEPESNSRPYEKFSGISNLFALSSNHQTASDKKAKEESGDYLSTLLHGGSYKKKDSPSGKNDVHKKLHI